ncbi:MAG: hypothetical protein L0J54_10150 [Halomonas sp.]|nr:hypothetical protein [Halomonas sp.]MDN6298367.1 hypothetical protein [Halomonas sp.]MDN6315602.1 hypothetical protein [Halomonas sp.]
MSDNTTPTHQRKKPTLAAELSLDEMDAMALVKRIRAEDPDALKRIGDKRAAKLVAASLRALRNTLDDVPERRVRLKEMGTFVVREVDNPKNGQLVQRIALNPAGREK